jgi:hypothetical protein
MIKGSPIGYCHASWSEDDKLCTSALPGQAVKARLCSSAQRSCASDPHRSRVPFVFEYWQTTNSSTARSCLFFLSVKRLAAQLGDSLIYRLVLCTGNMLMLESKGANLEVADRYRGHMLYNFP